MTTTQAVFEEVDAITIARLNGELTASQVEGLTEELHEFVARSGTRMAIDLSGVKLIDSSGLSLLMNVVSRARLSEGAVVLVAPAPFVSSIFSVTRLDNWFEICEDLQAAKERLAGA